MSVRKKGVKKKAGIRMCFELGTDSLTIIHPNDENPLCDKNKHDMRQYLHGGVNVTGEKFSVGFVFRVVNKTAVYRVCDDTMIIDNTTGQSDVVNGVLGVNLSSFHTKLYNLYLNNIC